MKQLLNKAGILSLIILAISFLGCEDDDDANGLPEVVAAFTQTQIENSGVVSFTNISENADSFMWDFGDGTTSTEIDPVKTFADGSFTVTLTASNTAGASNTFSDELTIDLPDPPPPFDSGLLTNGDFEDGAGPWFTNFGNNVPEIQEAGGNSFFFANVETANPMQPFLVNLSQVLAITQGTNYILTFNASSDQERTILAGIGLNEAPFSSSSPEVTLTTTTQTFTLQLAASDFGSANSRVLFDLAGDEGTVVIDNVSLVEGGDGSDSEDSVAPVITLTGDATINLTVGDPAYVDEGATATDNVDGDITSNITVGGDTVDTTVAGTYTITYNVSDAAGNAAAEVTRTVIVEAPVSPFCQTQIQAFGGDAGSDILISVFNVDAQTMRIEIESADSDPVDDLVLPAGDWNPVPGISVAPAEVSPGVWAGEFFYNPTAPDNVEFNILWSKVSFGGNWSMNAPGNLASVPFIATCDTSSGGGGGGGSGCTIGGAPTGPASTLPVGFEDCVGFDNTFGGVTAVLADNPSATGINTSATVLRVDKPTTADFFGGLQNSAGFDTGQFNGNPITVTFQVYSNLNDITFRCELGTNPVPDPNLGNPAPQFATLGSNVANTWVELSVTFTPNPGAETDYYNFFVIKPDDNQDDPNGSETDPPAADGIYYIDNITVQ
ncbi:MAG: immunoglobulin-like domain-containing protein [Bacteroidota bacterium]